MKQSILVGVIAVIGILLGAYLLGVKYGTPSSPFTGYVTVRYVGQIEDFSFEFTSVVAKGTKLTKPEDPTHHNNAFAGWYRSYAMPSEDVDYSSDLDEREWNFELGQVFNNMTLYATWKPIEYEVKFVDEDGWEFMGMTFSVIKDNKVERPEDPQTNPGCVVSRWLYEYDSGQLNEENEPIFLLREWDFENDVVTHNMMLYADWRMSISGYAANTNSSYVLDNDGVIWNWGQNLNPDSSFYKAPAKVKAVAYTQTPAKFVSMYSGAGSILALDEEGYLWGAGDNKRGQLGLGETEYFTQLNMLDIRVEDPTNPSTTGRPPNPDDENDLGEPAKDNRIRIKFKYAAIGLNHTIAIDQGGNLWAWGQNSFSQLGDSTSVSRIASFQYEDPSWPDHASYKLDHGDRRYSKVFVGADRTLAIDEAGNLWGWGEGIGNPRRVLNNIAAPEEDPFTFKSVIVGSKNNVVLTSLGRIFVWGTDAAGSSLDNPIELGAENIGDGLYYREIVAGDNYIIAIASDYKLYGWAIGDNNVVPIEYDKDDGTPIVDGLVGKGKLLFENMNFESIVAGGDHALAFGYDGNLWIWGANTHGQLGNGTTEKSDDLIKVRLI